MKANYTKFGALVILAGFLAGCASQYKPLTSYYDDFTRSKYDMTSANLLTVGATPGTDVWFDATRVQDRNGQTKYFLGVRYESASGPLNIEPGETLIVTVDGQDVRYSGMGSEAMREKIKGNIHRESTQYLVKVEDIRRIAEARQVKVVVKGKEGSVQRDFSQENLNVFKNFAGAYLNR